MWPRFTSCTLYSGGLPREYPVEGRAAPTRSPGAPLVRAEDAAHLHAGAERVRQEPGHAAEALRLAARRATGGAAPAAEAGRAPSGTGSGAKLLKGSIKKTFANFRGPFGPIATNLGLFRARQTS